MKEKNKPSPDIFNNLNPSTVLIQASNLINNYPQTGTKKVNNNQHCSSPYLPTDNNIQSSKNRYQKEQNFKTTEGGVKGVWINESPK